MSAVQYEAVWSMASGCAHGWLPLEQCTALFREKLNLLLQQEIEFEMHIHMLNFLEHGTNRANSGLRGV